jgi:hypothetical protein
MFSGPGTVVAVFHRHARRQWSQWRQQERGFVNPMGMADAIRRHDVLAMPRPDFRKAAKLAEAIPNCSVIHKTALRGHGC